MIKFKSDPQDPSHVLIRATVTKIKLFSKKDVKSDLFFFKEEK
jgi:hypothetical protein